MASENKAFALFEKYLMGPMGKVASWRFVRAIMAAGMASIPFVIVGSMFLVFNVLPQTFTFLQGFFDNSFFRVSDLYMLANKATMGIIALYFGLVVGYEYTKIFAEEENLNLSPLNGALLSLFAFFMTVPQLVLENGRMSLVHQIGDKIVHGWAMVEDGVSRLGATGIFVAIIMAIVAVQLYRLCVKQHWVIKMPEAVPEGVSRSFTALIPAFLVAITVLLINGILIALGTDIFKLVAIPFGFVVNLTSSWLGILVIYFIISALWLVGIHGTSIVFGFLTPIVLTNMQSNVDGANIPFAGEFNNAFVVMGGTGATLGLCLFIAFFARSKQLSVLGKAALAPGIFNINEPLMFGLPIVYNPFLAIPFFLAPMVSASIGYWAIKLQIVDAIVAMMPWPTPAGIGAFISTGGDYMAAVIALVCAFAAFLVWLPFIKIYDKRLVEQEKGAESATI
ncbi:PTS cellobiose transporter subunit IIC [Thermoactinomyces mirandus]|uniref:Permease IIC component n=1 Tax=Thermoactinomyces mirandus TaxID=2756294 RepID=A0A7W2AQQ5_9BACL|nr:PTS cellobiose transporter subunit IIC [Thermoactinomyces mirandus]MBA4601748.1 PTS cellobiose transporter subunit IIC [Thermoactinomyces mirandus]